MKRFIVTMVVAVVSLGLLGGSIALAQDITIGFTISGLFSPAFVEMLNQAELKADELGVELITTSADNDIDIQFEQVRDFIARGVDAIIINTIDSIAIVRAIEEANRAGIPVITVDRRAFGGDIFYHEETDNFNAGRLCAVWVAQHFKDDPGPVEIMIMRLDPAVDSVEERFQGFMFEVNQWANLEVVAAPNLGLDVGLGHGSVIDAFHANPDIRVIFIPGEPWLSGALSALREMDRLFPYDHPDHVFMVGVDGDQFAVANIFEGYYDFSAVQAIDMFTANAIEVFVNYKRYGVEPVMVENLIPVLGLNRYNIDHIKDQVWGYRVYLEEIQ